MSKKIIITGAAGFIGSNLAKRLLIDNISVIGIDNFSYGSEENLADIIDDKNFTFVNADVCNPSTLNDLEADVIVHLASQKIPRYSNALRTLDENQIMLKNVINKCLVSNTKLLFASTSDVYGKNPSIPFNEESDMVMGPTTVKRWAYALSKMYSEHAIIANNEQYGLEYTIVRFFGSYGPNHNLTWWGGPQSGFITKAHNDEEIEIHGDGQQTRTFTYIKDTVEALYLCLTKEEESKNEIFNIASEPDEEVTIQGLAELIWGLVRGAGSEPKLKFIPYSTFGKYEDVRRRVPDISKIKSTLGFQPQYNLERGMAETIEWQLNKINKKPALV